MSVVSILNISWQKFLPKRTTRYFLTHLSTLSPADQKTIQHLCWRCFLYLYVCICILYLSLYFKKMSWGSSLFVLSQPWRCLPWDQSSNCFCFQHQSYPPQKHDFYFFFILYLFLCSAAILTTQIWSLPDFFLLIVFCILQQCCNKNIYLFILFLSVFSFCIAFYSQHQHL